MTKHRSPEERRREILDAAARVIDEEGYRHLTMERIVAKTGLSKGGVYRFFPNKRAVGLELFRDVLGYWTRIDVEEALGWDLPVRQTLLRLLLHKGSVANHNRQMHRIWLQLLPACLDDLEFHAMRERERKEGQRRYRELIVALLTREGMARGDDIERSLEGVVAGGSLFVQGILLSALSGEYSEELEALVVEFIDGLLEKALQAVAQREVSALA